MAINVDKTGRVVSLLVGLMGLIALASNQIYSYGALNERIAKLEQTTKELKTDYVRKDVSERDLMLRDTVINQLKDEIVALREESKERDADQEKLLREILTKIHGV